MSFRYFLILQVIGRIKGERTLSGLIHILKGRQSVQTIQDCTLFHIEPLYHVLETVAREQLENLANECRDRGWIIALKGEQEKYILTPSGKCTLSQLAQKYSFPKALSYTENITIETEFWLKLQLLVQTLSELLHGSRSFLPVTRRTSVTEGVRKFIFEFHANRKTLAAGLHQELYCLFEKMPQSDATLLSAQLSGHSMPGLTLTQLSVLFNRDWYQFMIDSKSAFRCLMHQICFSPSLFPILECLMDKKPNGLSHSAEETYRCLREGLTIEELSVKRQLSKGTIEDHIIEMTLKIPEFNVSLFLTDSMNRLIIGTASQLQTKQLKPIKNVLNDQADYFQIRLALARDAMRERGAGQ
ncbi:helix-turn-helix domain-containing protein [Sporolactobacillus pectinivorans]|uniref:helix-turn-helix domain-containing protein n=1 Tax=Sporolactobacillus pectinivorans TaxID=1591408 RepID=UPI0012FD94F3|nr:helix-turn-helix domain-containing protein [Sporolactobacillus pectinivorans]